ncbi:MAG TPA: hypothetical protein VGH19_06070 [Verrucomicrobiae bacterium]
MGAYQSSPEDFLLPLKAVDPVVGVQVVVQSYFRGNFIVMKDGQVGLTEVMDDAFIFDYVADDIPGQIAELNAETGDYWIALPLKPSDALEVCDGCHEPFAVPSIFWDGQKHFTCRVCRRKEETQIYQKASGARSIRL